MGRTGHNGVVAKPPVQALTTDPADQQRIAERYPARSLGRTLLLAVVVLAGAALLVGWLSLGLRNSQRPPVEAELLTHHVISNEEAGYRLLVGRTDPSRPAVCTVQAQAQNFEHVGTAEVTIPPAEQEVVEFTGSLRTVREADAVYVENCRLQ